MKSGEQGSAYRIDETQIDGHEVVRLEDLARAMRVSIAPSLGNTAFEFGIHGHNALYFPFSNVEAWAKAQRQVGIPFLGPWANRLSGDFFYANGKKYLLNPNLLTIPRDSSDQPIHGLLVFADAWHRLHSHAGPDGAEVTSRLDFWKQPAWMAQFPFAHSIDMTHRLSEGILEVRVAIHNLSLDPMPLVMGFHPWYQITDAPREQWCVHLPVKTHYPLSPRVIPTGEEEPVSLDGKIALGGRGVDDVFGEIDHVDEFTLSGRNQKIAVRFGPKYSVAIVYSPPGCDFVCFEPMSGLTDGFNLAHAGCYAGLQHIPRGETWTESFWVTPTGF